MKTGDEVIVYPHGNPERTALGRVAIISSNQRAIAVGFMEKPPFVMGDPLSMAIHPEYGIMLFASRVELNDVPWGPWIEMMGGGHFEIEEAP